MKTFGKSQSVTASFREILVRSGFKPRVSQGKDGGKKCLRVSFANNPSQESIYSIPSEFEGLPVCVHLNPEF